jgi:hypothetical protein
MQLSKRLKRKGYKTKDSGILDWEAVLPAWFCPGLCCVEAEGGVARLGTAPYCHLRAHSTSCEVKARIMTLGQRKSFCRCLCVSKKFITSGGRWNILSKDDIKNTVPCRLVKYSNQRVLNDL